MPLSSLADISNEGGSKAGSSEPSRPSSEKGFGGSGSSGGRQSGYTRGGGRAGGRRGYADSQASWVSSNNGSTAGSTKEGQSGSSSSQGGRGRGRGRGNSNSNGSFGGRGSGGGSNSGGSRGVSPAAAYYPSVTMGGQMFYPAAAYGVNVSTEAAANVTKVQVGDCSVYCCVRCAVHGWLADWLVRWGMLPCCQPAQVCAPKSSAMAGGQVDDAITLALWAMNVCVDNPTACPCAWPFWHACSPRRSAHSITLPILGHPCYSPACSTLPSLPHPHHPPAPHHPQVMEAVKKQIDYYFSVDNLCKDIFLRSKMDEAGWIPMPVIANFNRVRMLTPDLMLITDALKTSDIVEVRGCSVGLVAGIAALCLVLCCACLLHAWGCAGTSWR